MDKSVIFFHVLTSHKKHLFHVKYSSKWQILIFFNITCPPTLLTFNTQICVRHHSYFFCLQVKNASSVHFTGIHKYITETSISRSQWPEKYSHPLLMLYALLCTSCYEYSWKSIILELFTDFSFPLSFSPEKISLKEFRSF